NALRPPRPPKAAAQLLNCSTALTPPPLQFKILPLERNWSATLRLEKWQLHPRLAQHFFVCPHCRRKCLKLFLPLCLKQEYHDALLAHLYLNSLRARRPNAPGSEEERLLHTRYGLLFPPVLPRCRQCLPLRYGEVKKKKPR
ncbi:MAG: hypothetical protein IT442_04235, partial [Phycisphaeraceae bacterium]|nr:hypothetical protein [Phycisphaeraceae bacterium]